MGAWGELAFDNDTACDWVFELEGIEDLSLVESALAEVAAVKDAYLDQDSACNALAACEVLARLNGQPGYNNASTEAVDRWVAAHPIRPSDALLGRAEAAIARVVADESELRALWQEVGEASWLRSVEDLRRRLRA
jgi:Domain of unknown function (DUF4259)